MLFLNGIIISFISTVLTPGHEFVAASDWDRALNSFRVALRLDNRHYNAWFGIGQIYLSQQRVPMAHHHFTRSLEINPASSVLHCYMGMVHIANKSLDDALVSLNRAIDLDPKNTLAKYKRVTVLVQ